MIRTLAFLGLIALSTVAASAERKGLAIIGLSRLSQNSVDKIGSAVTESGIRRFEFSYMPFFNSNRPFDRAKRLINGLRADLRSRTTETIYLAWKEESLVKRLEFGKFEERAKRLNNRINDVAAYGGRVVIVPVLEDQWNEKTWLKALRVIAKNLDPKHRARIRFRRCPEGTTDSLEIRGKLDLRMSDGKVYTFPKADLEFHRETHDGKANVISNDGGLVAQDKPIRIGDYELRDAMQYFERKAVALDDWIVEANRQSRASLLWRPSFNLFSWESKNGVRSYKKKGELPDRLDQGLDDFEAYVIRKFLRS